MLNPVQINQTLSQMPEGLSIDQRRSRNVGALGIAVAKVCPMPGAAVASRRDYFYENLEAIRQKLFKINEVCSIDVDRVCEVAYRIWSVRYDAAYAPFAVMFFSEKNPFMVAIQNNINDFDSMQLDSSFISEIADLLRDDE